MRTNHVISISQIAKRNLAQSSLNEGSDAGYLYNIYRNSVKHESSQLEQSATNFFKGCANAKNANKYYSKCLSVLEEVKDNSRLIKVLENYMASEITPYITNLYEFDEEISHFDLANSTVEALTEASTVNKVCQRILNNNEKISERFNFDKYIRENGRKPMEPIVLKCCSMIDTYRTPGYAKLNIALEEISYMYQKNAIPYDKPKMVQLVTEYFLSRSQHIEKSDMALYKEVLLDNCCISDADLSGVSYFIKEDFSVEKEPEEKPVNPYDVTVTVDTDDILDVAKRKLDALTDPENPVQTAFDVYKSSEDKTSETFSSFIDHILAQKTSNIIEVLPSILDWFRNFALANLLTLNDVITFVSGLLDKSTSLEHITVKEAEDLRDIFQNEINKLNAFMNADDADTEQFSTFTQYVNSLQSIVDSLQQYVLDRESIETGIALDKMKNEGAYMSLDEFKIFKFQNLITAAYKVDKALRKGSAKLTKAIKNKAVEVYTSLKNWINEGYDLSNIESENLIDCISEDGSFDHILHIYNVPDMSNISEVTMAFKEFCNAMNTEFGKDNSVRVYIECIDNIIEFHICDTTNITLTEEQQEEWERTFSESEQVYCGYLISLAESMENFYDMASTRSLAKDFAEIEATLEAEDLVSVIELSKYMGGMISYGRLESLAEIYSINHPNDYSGNVGIKHALEGWKIESVDFGTQVEAISMLREAIDTCLLTEAEVNKDDPHKLPNNVKKPEEKEDEKKTSKIDTAKEKVKDANDKLRDKGKEGVEKTKISFNTLKYALSAFRQKAKEFGDKGTKVSHELDVYVEKFINSVKALYTNDNREQIIKGSIIPSFHQLMGRIMVIGASTGAGGLIGAATTVGGPAGALFAAAVTTFATIAISKNTTDKQRALMLDELDVELEVCERELQKADANGQVKKARAIMMRKKKLQREMVRIKYHIKDNSLIKPAEFIPDKD